MQIAVHGAEHEAHDREHGPERRQCPSECPPALRQQPEADRENYGTQHKMNQQRVTHRTEGSQLENIHDLEGLEYTGSAMNFPPSPIRL